LGSDLGRTWRQTGEDLGAGRREDLEAGQLKMAEPKGIETASVEV
jgi:hypothetical protein